MNFKQEILKEIKYENIDFQNSEQSIVTPPQENMGDYSLPCFGFAKILHKSPIQIANEIAKCVNVGGLIEKIEVVNGYLNFFLNKTHVTKLVLEDIEKKGFKNKENNGKIVCIDYSSVNLAKYMHIGHWTTTALGEVIGRLYESQGYNVKRLNYVGDYGLPFGKMIYAYLTWGNKNDINSRGVDAIQDLYVKFCANENEELLEKARQISKKIEDFDKEIYPIYEWFIDISKKECKRILDKVGITFDSWKGESAYNNKMDTVIEEVENSGLGKMSEGAYIVDLSNYGLGVAVIQRNDGASLYITRDLAAVQDRYSTYNFDEMIYVTAVQQCNHFQKLFKLCELLKKPYAGKLFHAYYGMFSLPEGKIASRKGKQALFEDILNETQNKVKETLANKNFSEQEKEEISLKIAKSAVVFSVIKSDRAKDKVFDIEKAVSFDGESAPYIEYTYARMNSITRKANILNLDNIKQNLNENVLNSIFPMIKILNNFNETIYNSYANKEPSILVRELLDLCQYFNKFYAEFKIVDENNLEQTSVLLSLIECIKSALSYGMNLLLIDKIEKM